MFNFSNKEMVRTDFEQKLAMTRTANIFLILAKKIYRVYDIMLEITDFKIQYRNYIWVFWVAKSLNNTAK